MICSVLKNVFQIFLNIKFSNKDNYMYQTFICFAFLLAQRISLCVKLRSRHKIQSKSRRFNKYIEQNIRIKSFNGKCITFLFIFITLKELPGHKYKKVRPNLFNSRFSLILRKGCYALKHYSSVI